jgi:hypothetical protein
MITSQTCQFAVVVMKQVRDKEVHVVRSALQRRFACISFYVSTVDGAAGTVFWHFSVSTILAFLRCLEGPYLPYANSLTLKLQTARSSESQKKRSKRQGTKSQKTFIWLMYTHPVRVQHTQCVYTPSACTTHAYVFNGLVLKCVSGNARTSKCSF